MKAFLISDTKIYGFLFRFVFNDILQDSIGEVRGNETYINYFKDNIACWIMDENSLLFLELHTDKLCLFIYQLDAEFFSLIMFLLFNSQIAYSSFIEENQTANSKCRNDCGRLLHSISTHQHKILSVLRRF